MISNNLPRFIMRGTPELFQTLSLFVDKVRQEEVHEQEAHSVEEYVEHQMPAILQPPKIDVEIDWEVYDVERKRLTNEFIEHGIPAQAASHLVYIMETPPGAWSADDILFLERVLADYSKLVPPMSTEQVPQQAFDARQDYLLTQRRRLD